MKVAFTIIVYLKSFISLVYIMFVFIDFVVLPFSRYILHSVQNLVEYNTFLSLSTGRCVGERTTKNTSVSCSKGSCSVLLFIKYLSVLEQEECVEEVFL